MSEPQQGNGLTVVPPGQPTQAPGGRGQLAAALAKAQRTVRRVDHDQRNNFHGYAYTSAEAVIEAAKDPLADAGLALLPLEETLDGHEKEGEHRYELVCKFVLIHSSGESVPLLRHWPVCPEKGRPLDKATAAASTLALAYLLRDLLLMPRVDPSDDLAAREDRPARKPQQQPPPQQAAAGKPPKQPHGPPKDGAELSARVDEADGVLARYGSARKGELAEHVQQLGRAAGFPPSILAWEAEQLVTAAQWVKEFVAAHPQPKKGAPPTQAAPAGAAS